jgi:hypothetical protein
MQSQQCIARGGEAVCEGGAGMLDDGGARVTTQRAISVARYADSRCRAAALPRLAPGATDLRTGSRRCARQCNGGDPASHDTWPGRGAEKRMKKFELRSSNEERITDNEERTTSCSFLHSNFEIRTSSFAFRPDGGNVLSTPGAGPGMTGVADRGQPAATATPAFPGSRPTSRGRRRRRAARRWRRRIRSRDSACRPRACPR